MFMRVTHYKMKPNSIVAAKAMVAQMQEQIMGMPGMLRFTNSINDDGSGCVVALVESKALSDANAGRVAEAWAAFSDHLDGAPEPRGFEVFADWSN
ncbi:hypothetical protein [uncultured Roseovarius sp.]|uniref:hypothetical protein n=1 Tax=uncultured Roseovarius sp. TaxID=293344 RepID=UPI00261CB5F8|nr:hypothetical protein [uncultured Roseovarius sp.]